MEFVLPMVIWPEFRMEQYRDDYNREDALNFMWSNVGSNEVNIRTFPFEFM